MASGGWWGITLIIGALSQHRLKGSCQMPTLGEGSLINSPVKANWPGCEGDIVGDSIDVHYTSGHGHLTPEA